MKPEQFLAHFDRISEVPDAIPRLRRFILDLGVRGKLVEQDPKDEPAPELLKRIYAARALLAKSGKIRRQEILDPIEPDEVPFEVPPHWALIRLGDALELINGRAFKPNEWSMGGVPIIRIQNLNNEDAPFNHCDTAIPERFHVKTGDFLISWSGTPGTSFGAHIWERGYALLNQHIFRVELIGDGFLLPFLKLAINSRLLELIDRAHGGAGLQHITRPSLEELPLTLPSLAEQHRIVTKVDELMALCDLLEAAQEERESRRARLAAASLQQLNQPSNGDAASFRKHARFHLRNLPRFTSRPEQIQQLRQTILNLAVRGKIVSQSPKDEPATRLLERIQTEKRRLAKNGEIKMEKFLPVIGDTDFTFTLPNGWAWARWQSIAFKIGDIDHKMPETATKGIPYVSPRDFLPGNRIDFEGAKRVSFEDFARLASKIKPSIGDLIYPRYGTIGENRLVEEQRDFLVSYSCAVIKVMHGFVNPKYQYMYSVSPYCRQQAKAAENKATQANVGIKSIQEFIVPLPPLAEQHRIVAKVDELLTLCDQLEAHLTAGQTESRRLLEAILYEALANT